MARDFAEISQADGGVAWRAKPLEIFPKLRPAFARWSANEDVWMVFALFILDAVRIAVVAGESAGLKMLLQIFARDADDDDGFKEAHE